MGVDIRLSYKHNVRRIMRRIHRKLLNISRYRWRNPEKLASVIEKDIMPLAEQARNFSQKTFDYIRDHTEIVYRALRIAVQSGDINVMKKALWVVRHASKLIDNDNIDSYYWLLFKDILAGLTSGMGVKHVIMMHVLNRAAEMRAIITSAEMALTAAGIMNQDIKDSINDAMKHLAAISPISPLKQNLYNLGRALIHFNIALEIADAISKKNPIVDRMWDYFAYIKVPVQILVNETDELI